MTDSNFGFDPVKQVMHIPFEVYTLMGANREVADQTILKASELLATLWDLSDSKDRDLAICEEKAFELMGKVEDRNERIGNILAQLDDQGIRIAGLRPWATIGKIVVYGTLVVVVFIAANEAFGFIPEVNIF